MYLKSYCLMTSLMTKFPTKLFFLRRLILAESSVQAIIRFLRLSASGIGIIAGVKTRELEFTPR